VQTSTFLGREILEVLAVKLDPSNQSMSHLADCWCLMFFFYFRGIENHIIVSRLDVFIRSLLLVPYVSPFF
jgi:hypothetical protein